MLFTYALHSIERCRCDSFFFVQKNPSSLCFGVMQSAHGVILCDRVCGRVREIRNVDGNDEKRERALCDSEWKCGAINQFGEVNICASSGQRVKERHGMLVFARASPCAWVRVCVSACDCACFPSIGTAAHHIAVELNSPLAYFASLFFFFNLQRHSTWLLCALNIYT